MLKRWHVLFMLLCFDKVLQSHTENETSSVITIRQTDTDSSCSKGWFSFGNMCYKFGGKNNIRRLPWEQAAEACRKDYKGKLATIYSKELSDFLVAFFHLNAKENVWIGLHDRINESVYAWDDGTPATNESYFNWEPTEPTGLRDEKEDCVEVAVHSIATGGIAGQWNDVDCSTPYQFICQKEKGKLSRDYLDPRFCPSEVGRGWKKNPSCFNIIDEEKTWSDAEEYCIQTFKGHLVTITDFTVNIFLNYILQDREKDMWIGIRTKKQLQQQWSSGWYVSYENWAEGEKPNEFDEGSCGSHNHDGKWITHPCSKMLPFVCEYSTEKPPMLKPKTEGSYCPNAPADWRDLGGDFCYYFELVNLVSWYEANFLCLRRGGTLASILSREESNILQNFIKFMQNTIYFKLHKVHIGLHQHIHEGEFAWADGSPLHFTDWGDNEPDSEKEHCVEMHSEHMKWSNIDCLQKRGYICSVKKIPLNHERCSNITIVQSPCFLSDYSASILVGITVCVLIAFVVMGIIIFYFWFRKRIMKKSVTKLQVHNNKPTHSSENIINDDNLYDTEI